MSEIAFFDTNILLYICERRELVKREIARRLYAAHLEDGTLRISTQVVQEFYAAATRKLGMPLADAAAQAEALCGLELLVVGPPEILRAFSVEQRYRINFWDALIVSSAVSANAATLFTEDLTHGQRIGKLQIVNPFRSQLS